MEKTTPKPFCFVLMPFDHAFADVYQIGIKESCAAAGTYCERVDEQIFDGRILDRIYNQIAKADIVIADMTGRNPNVFYEVGYAHALGKRTVLITKISEDIPFDLKHFPHIIYESKLLELREQLTKRLQWFVANPEITQAKSRDPFELFLGANRLTQDKLEFNFNSNGDGPTLPLLIQNTSSEVLVSGSLKPVFLLPANSGVLFPQDGTTVRTTLPSGERQVAINQLPQLLPGQFADISISFYPNDVKTLDFSIRVYSELGPRDFKILGRWA